MRSFSQFRRSGITNTDCIAVSFNELCIRNLTRYLLYALNKFPVEVVADFLPDLVVGNQAVPGLQQGKEHLVLI